MIPENNGPTTEIKVEVSHFSNSKNNVDSKSNINNKNNVDSKSNVNNNSAKKESIKKRKKSFKK